jgi:hypothetical protein
MNRFLVGDHIEIFPTRHNTAGRHWQMTFKGEQVAAIRGIRARGELYEGVLEVEFVKTPTIEPDATVIEELRRNGWQVRLHVVEPREHPTEILMGPLGYLKGGL